MADEGSSETGLRDVLAVFQRPDDPATPFTATEVADELGCARRTAFDKLERLAEGGDLETKKTGARGRVWWRPMAAAEREEASNGTSPGEVLGSDLGEDAIALEETNAIVRDVGRALVTASTREDAEAAVCDRLASADRFSGAWIGSYDEADDAVSPRVSAGVPDAYLDAIAGATGDVPERRAVAAALRTGGVQPIEGPPSDGVPQPLHDGGVPGPFTPAIAIPLLYDEVEYGVLTVYTDRESSFDEHERTVLRELGETASHAMAELRSEEREETLTALHESTRELLHTETHEAIGDVVVETVVRNLGLSDAVVYRFDTNEHVLVPLSSAVRTETALDQLPVLHAGEESPVWTSFVEGQSSIVTECSEIVIPHDGTTDTQMLVVPLGDHGVLAAGVPADGPIQPDRRKLLELVGATAGAAFDRVESQANIRERDAILQEQNQRLQRLNQINTVIREIDQALVSAETRAEVQRVVCERLSESERFRFAWIGESDEVDGVVPVAVSGSGRGYLDSVPLKESDEPAAVAVRTGEVIVVSNVADDLRRSPWRSAAFAREFQSVITVPLADGEMTYGVLTVYADRPDVFGEMEQSVFAELGGTIANSIASVETKQALLGDQLVELEFLLGDGSTSFLSRVASEIDCDIAFEGVIPLADSRSRVFFTASGAERDAVCDVLDRSVAVESNDLVASGDEDHLFEVVLNGENVALSLIENGGSLKELRVADDEIRVVVDLPASADVREFIAEFQQTYTDAEFVARRESDRIAQTKQEFRAELQDHLTARQLEVLKTAYYSGFFASPRRSTGSDVGDVLGVSQPTVTEHLRSAQSKLLDRLFADESGSNR